MLPLKLVRSLVSGDDVTNNPLIHRLHHDNLEQDSDENNDPTISRNRIPLMLFLPNQELVRDTYRLASIARVIGMDLHFNPSLSHIIFSWAPPPPAPQSCTPSSSSSTTSTSTSTLSTSSTYTWSLPNDSVPLPFPSFATASLSHLRLFISLSKGYFKLAFLKNGSIPHRKIESLSNNNWHCTSLSLFIAPTAEKIESMDGFSKALLGRGWALFKTNSSEFQDSIGSEIYLYRKMDVSRICSRRESSRVRELRLPELDFGNTPLRILQYILLMTDNLFYLA